MARSASPRAALRSKPDHFVPPDVGSSVQPYQEQGAKERECARESRRSAPRKPLPSGISSGRPALDPIVARNLTMPSFAPQPLFLKRTVRYTKLHAIRNGADDADKQPRCVPRSNPRPPCPRPNSSSRAGARRVYYYRDAAPNPSPTKPPPPSRHSRNSSLNPRRLELRVRCRYPKRAEHR